MNDNPYSHMDKEAYRIAYLIAGYIRNTLTNAEHQELDDWVNASDKNMKLFEDLTDERNIEANLQMMEKVQSEQLFEQLKQEGRFEKPIREKSRLIWMPAAAIAILLCIYIAQRYINSPSTNNDKLETVQNGVLQPGGNKATLTLPDGAVIDLANVQTGVIATGTHVKVTKEDEGSLVYQGTGENHKNEIHVLTTPVGGQFQLMLDDGTKVWLNSTSTLRYPTSFAQGEREVELTGEAYFEVAHNASHPFKVMLADSNTITVLGTHFNVQAFPDEKSKDITLVQGKVLVQSGKSQALLSPGMQASIQEGAITTTANVDIEEITGWKNGLFVFHDAPIEYIMDQVARWYDAKVVYQGSIGHQFNATILRSEPLSRLLYLLELNGHVKFKTENNIIYVLP